ncbi:MAG: precorrin-6y C5,15-methyltransferase (decarboxylating) subunit CbiE [Actinomycetota bacterium]|nr:precorrin-6y C5,15-methyltransferase (decarboxylating) subunit CbiE [Actinomycetota bacterium]
MAVKNKAWVTIVGCGPGCPTYLTEAGRRAIGEATLLTGPAHLLNLYAGPTQLTMPFEGDVDGLLDKIAPHLSSDEVVILVSGDPGISSLAKSVIARFKKENCAIIPGVSSLQLAFARLGEDWLGAKVISAHNAIPSLSSEEILIYDKIAILMGGSKSLSWLIDLCAPLNGAYSIFLFQDLSLESEKVVKVSVDELKSTTISSRTIALLIKEVLL